MMMTIIKTSMAEICTVQVYDLEIEHPSTKGNKARQIKTGIHKRKKESGEHSASTT